ncbi:MAG: hypothetical protein HFJ87_09985 [Muribaculaceae bacterium]|nr:hypothetical protein [Muribaculaceae bacterium]
MKRQLLNFLFGGTLCALTMTSCSDSEPGAVKPADDEIAKTGIISYAESKIVKLPVSATGTWTASVPEDCDWMAVLKKEGSGNDVITLVLDDNFGGEMRVANITLTSEAGSTEVKVTQYGVLDGVAPDNGDQDYIKTAATKNLGFGVNLIEYYDNPTVGLKYKNNSAFNLAALEELKDSKKIAYSNIITATPREKVVFQAARMDSLIDKCDSLGVSLDFNISYAAFKLGISGAYHGSENLKNHTIQMGYSAEYPILDANIAYADALTHYGKYASETSPDEEDMRGYILTVGIASLRNDIEQAVANKNDSAIKGNIKKLISRYGTGVVVGSTLGGRITMDLEIDSIYVSEEMGVDKATLTANFSMGLFKLDAKVEVSYLNSSLSVLRHSRYLLEMTGGDRDARNDVLNALNAADYNTDIPNLISAWANTIKTDQDPNKNNADLIEVSIIPIWEIFDDYNCQEAVIEYLKSIYPKSSFLYKYENGELVDDAVSSGSDAAKSSRRFTARLH